MEKDPIGLNAISKVGLASFLMTLLVCKLISSRLRSVNFRDAIYGDNGIGVRKLVMVSYILEAVYTRPIDAADGDKGQGPQSRSSTPHRTLLPPARAGANRREDT